MSRLRRGRRGADRLGRRLLHQEGLIFDVTTGPSSDVPCTITADLYTPAGVSKGDPAPAILATNGFGGSKSEFGALAASYARRGYVFLAYSGLGFGGSGCKITLDDPDYDGKAGSQLVSFLGGSKAAKDGTKIDYVLRDTRAHDGSRRGGASIGDDLCSAVERHAADPPAGAAHGERRRCPPGPAVWKLSARIRGGGQTEGAAEEMVAADRGWDGEAHGALDRRWPGAE